MKRWLPKIRGIVAGGALVWLYTKYEMFADYVQAVGWDNVNWLVVADTAIRLAFDGLIAIGALWVKSPRDIGTKRVPAPNPPRLEPAIDNEPLLVDFDPSIVTLRKKYDWKWSAGSRKRMEGVHADIVRLISVALQYSPYDAGIAYLGGVRTIEQQLELLAQGGKTQIKNSRHLHGLALDVLMYDEHGNYTHEPKYYLAFEKAVAYASELTGIPYLWGGTWTSIKDYAHYELPRDRYPDVIDVPVAA